MLRIHQTFSLRGIGKRSTTGSEAAEFGRDARSDWRTVVFTFLFLNLLSIGTSIMVYERIHQGDIFLVDKREAVSLGTLDRFALEKTVAFFEEKQERFDAIRRVPLFTPDPFVPPLQKKKQP